MSDLNLNDPNGFAALTSAFGSAFGGAQDQIWNISESSFKNIPFHIFTSAQASPGGSPINYSAGVGRVHDSTGRRKTKYQFPFQDGQTTGDLGRSPFVFEFNVIFFGANYFAGYTAFYNALNQATPGTLRHPVLGDRNCVPTDWEVVHESQSRLSLAMTVRFEEHTYDPGLTFQNVPTITQPVSTGSPSTLKSAVLACLSVFQTVNQIQTAITSNLAYATSFKNGVVNLVNGTTQSFLLTLQSVYLSFAPASVSLSPDLPGVLPTNLGGQVNSAGKVNSNLYPLTNNSLTPFSTAATPSSTNPQSLTPIQAQNQVNVVLGQLEAAVQMINGGNDGQGALDFYDQVLTLKQAGVLLRNVLIQAIASSNNVTTQYTINPTVPYMSVREVAFAIGLDVNSSDQITQLNPQLLSVNQIPGGTTLNIPVVASS